MCDHTLQVQLQNALAAIVAELIDCPAQRPYSSDSYLPHHLVDPATQALSAAGVGVAALQVKGGAV